MHRCGNAIRLTMVYLSGAAGAAGRRQRGAQCVWERKTGKRNGYRPGRGDSEPRQGVRVRFADAVTRYQSGGSDRRAVSASGESCRMSSRQSRLRFRVLLTAEVAQHRLSFRPRIPRIIKTDLRSYVSCFRALVQSINAICRPTRLINLF